MAPTIPRFDGHYDHWTLLIENLLRSKGYWNLVETESTEVQKKELEDLMMKDLNYLFQAINRIVLEQILEKHTTKQIWDSMKKKFERNARVEPSILRALRRDFEVLEMKVGETITEYFTRVMAIANNMRSNGEDMKEVTIVEKILRTLIEKFNYVVVSIKNSVRMIITLVTQRGWKIFQLDVNSAFLHGTLSEDVYVEQPKGYYKKGGIEELRAYTDSDYAGDLEDRKNTSRNVFIMSGGLVAWSSRKQPIVTLSATEVEFIAATGCACQAVWMRRVLKKLGYNQEESTVIKCDNCSTIKLSKNPVMHGRSKHIDLRFHFLRDLTKNNEIDELVHCGTQDQVADVMTKPLKLDSFHKLRVQLGMCEVLELNKMHECN
uniref:Retrovirus-related Pol polyprotein from transposon TNT 1-94 n=1 Tax=Cajanus cajan TaxID=3821 RepID=A0A151RDV7_CAJCA|nr:Retrovirus-related Pol polyprotein from transposon TNT 1-94 [Cajanus cajan]